nr:Bro-N domain-containing protein [Prevotella sp.]
MKKTNVKVVGSKAAANTVASNAANHENAIRVMVFECSEFGSIRILTDEKGEPQFCGNDVCKALGYDQARKAILRHVKPTDGTKRTASVTIRRNCIK